MVKDLYSSLLEELGRTLQIPDLHADRNNSCQIRLKDGLQLQIEIHPKSDSMLLVAISAICLPAASASTSSARP